MSTSPIIVTIPDDIILVDVPQKLPLGCSTPYPTPAPDRYGSFYDTTTQTASLTAKAVSINAISGADHVTLSDIGRINLPVVGTYKLTFSIQLMNTDNAVHYADIWLKYNGANYPYSNTRFHIPARKSSTEYGYAVATVDYIGTSQNIGDFVELFWRADSTQVSIPTIPAYDGVPDTPGVIVNISQVS